MLTMGGGGGADATRSVLAGKILRDTVSTIDKKTSSAIVLMMSANYGGQLVGESGNLAYDSSGNVAWQTTQSVGSSTSVVWGASFGVGRTISTADDIRNFEGAATGIGLTLCLPEGFSVDIMWFESTTDPGKMEYALTIAYVWGAELEGHLLEAYTETKHLLNLWSIFD